MDELPKLLPLLSCCPARGQPVTVPESPNYTAELSSYSVTVLPVGTSTCPACGYAVGPVTRICARCHATALAEGGYVWRGKL